ncbi:MAG: helix-turn-helix transcriptional regulator [Peptoniphilaceae bacterium]
MIIREKRLEKNLTQESLAERVQVSRTMISKLESGQAKPSVETAKRLGATLGFKWSKIFEE